jgi:hypothetical protein
VPVPGASAKALSRRSVGQIVGSSWVIRRTAENTPIKRVSARRDARRGASGSSARPSTRAGVGYLRLNLKKIGSASVPRPWGVNRKPMALTPATIPSMRSTRERPDAIAATMPATASAITSHHTGPYASSRPGKKRSLQTPCRPR